MNGRILVAGIGNIFLGDDAFGCAVVRRLAERPMPANVRVVDYGIRGFDLAFALLEDDDAFILVDAAPRGEAPGTLYTIEVDTGALDATGSAEMDPHGMNPLRVLQMARAMGGSPSQVYVVGCEPGNVDEGMGLSEPVQAALDGAAAMVQSLVERLSEEQGEEHEHLVESYGSGAGSGGSGRRGA